MDVVNYLKQQGLEKLKEEFFIKVKEYDEGLIVLNYDQIASPKAHPIVVECRGLILDKEFNVVSRSFCRFFNIGEQPETQAHIDMRKAVCFDKIDGSLIKIYFWNGLWHIATRGTAFAESEVNGFDVSFKDLVMRALDVYDDEEFQFRCNNILCEDVTYICEITSMENRVVTRYDGYDLHYLAARNNKTFEYVDGSDSAQVLGCKFPTKYYFHTTADCIEAAKHLKNLDEGYVLYQDGKPVCKIKSPVYCAIHLIKGEGLNPKRIAELVLTGEQAEYIAYFPEDEKYITPYEFALEQLLISTTELWESSKHLESQKDFAMAVKDSRQSALLFWLRKFPAGVAKDALNAQTDAYKLKLLLDCVQEKIQ